MRRIDIASRATLWTRLRPCGAHWTLCASDAGLTLRLRSKRKVALITGITGASLASSGTADSVTGQDGSYLTELLLEKGYTVHGIIRRSSSFNTGRIEHLYKDVHERPRMVLHYGDLTVRAQARTTLRPQDTTNLVSIVAQVQPSEIYNLAAQSHVKVSFDMAEYTGDVDGLGSALALSRRH